MNKLHRVIVGTTLLGVLSLGAGCTAHAPQPEMHQGNTSDMATTGSETPTSAITGSATVTDASAAPAGSAGTAATPPASTEPGAPAGMMTQDPRSITEVDGKIVEVQTTELLVQKGSVTLRFQLAPDTAVKPDGKKLAAGEDVKIHIEQVPDGMKAKEVDIH